MKVLLAHPGTQHSFRLARELDRRGLLGEFWTGLALREGSWAAALADRLSGASLMGGLRSRVARNITPSRVHSVALNELRTLARLRCGAEAEPVLHARNRRFQQAIPDRSLDASDAVIAFDTSAWLLAERARACHRPLLLDRSIACASAVEALLADVHRRYPEWLPAPAGRFPALVAAERQEHALAVRIVVGSSFARATLLAEGVEAAKVRINPYGVDWARFAAAATGVASIPGRDRPLRFLFVGSVTGRKGVPVLLEAWQRLAPRTAELWLAGNCAPRERTLIPPLPGLRVLGRVPNADIPGLYANADVLVLPSLYEGFGLVLLEALAAGLPVISTPNTGCADLLVVPELGRSVTPGSAESLMEALAHQLAHPPVRAQVVAAASPLAARFSWEAYGDRWAALLREDLPVC